LYLGRSLDPVQVQTGPKAGLPQKTISLLL
jgi:hypothetical protein